MLLVIIYNMPKIGNTDKPYALTLASHIASEYNTKLMSRNKLINN